MWMIALPGSSPLKLFDMSAQPTSTRRLQRNLSLLALTMLLGAACILGLWFRYPDPEGWKLAIHAVIEWLSSHPWALILSLATLPGLGFPISPIFILFGAVLGPKYGIFNTCLIGIFAQSICSAWAYALAAGPLRQFVLKYLLKNRTLPTLTPQNAWRMACILRITPGIPYALQNFVLGVIKLPFRIYMLVSVPIQSLYCVGFIVSGGAIFSGRIGLALTVGVFLIALILATRIYLSRNKKRC